jgi:HlyD family secretion protein
MKKAIVIILVVALAASSIWLWKTKGKKTDEIKEEVKIVEVTRGRIAKTVEASGVVVSNMDVEIKSKASGEIITLPFDVSDTVPKGALVAELDPVDEQRNLNKAQASLDSSRAGLSKAQGNLAVSEKNLAIAYKNAEVSLKSAKSKAQDADAKLERVRQLYEKKLASREELDTAQTSATTAWAAYEQAKLRFDELDADKAALVVQRQDIIQARANLESASMNMELTRQGLDDTKIYAPSDMDGVITARNVQIGQIISSGISNVGGGTTILVISDMSKIFVNADVDESDIANVQRGQPVKITVDAYPNERFMGKVERVARKGKNTSNVVTFEVKIEVMSDNKNLLMPEMSADVEIIVEMKQDALTIPASAVSRNDKGEKVATLVTGPDKTEKRVVETGIETGFLVEITSGLEPGDKIQVKQGADASKWSQTGRQGPPGGGMMPGAGPGRRGGH